MHGRPVARVSLDGPPTFDGARANAARLKLLADLVTAGDDE